MGKVIEIAVAAVLAGITLAGTYLVWYALFGKRLRHRGDDTRTDGEPKKKKAHDSGHEKWGVDKKAYCYPHINDIMGYEFVKVITIKTDTSDNKSPEDKKLEETTDGRSRRATVVSLSSKEERDKFRRMLDETNDSAPDDGENPYYGSHEPDIDDEDEEQYEPTEEEQDEYFSAIQQLEEVNWGDYETIDHDFDMNDSQFDDLVKNNVLSEDGPKPTEEDYRISEIVSALRSAEEMKRFDEKLEDEDDEINKMTSQLLDD